MYSQHYTVKAETPDDFAATVGFAHKHNLRLVVKGTGHDWYGRSAAAGSLLLWTHLRKKKVWHDAFVPEGCSPAPAGSTANDAAVDVAGAPPISTVPSPPPSSPAAPVPAAAAAAVPAVTVESGVQFYDLYPAAMARGRLVVGGTCPTVGVGGCWLSGCYGAFARKYGNGAMNILEAKIVLANGTLVTTNKCQHPDLFWSLRGGGGGNVGVVVDFVARTHPSPTAMSSLSLAVSTKSAAQYRILLEKLLAVYAVMAADADSASDGGFGFGTQTTGESASWDASTNYTASVHLIGYFTTAAKQLAIIQPVIDYIHNLTAAADANGQQLAADAHEHVRAHSGSAVHYTVAQDSWNAKDDYNKSANNQALGFPWGGG